MFEIVWNFGRIRVALGILILVDWVLMVVVVVVVKMKFQIDTVVMWRCGFLDTSFNGTDKISSWLFWNFLDKGRCQFPAFLEGVNWFEFVLVFTLYNKTSIQPLLIHFSPRIYHVQRKSHCVCRRHDR